MTQVFHIHPVHPQGHLIQETVKVLMQEGVVVYPTDSTYALACRLANKAGANRIKFIRQLPDTHHFTLVCSDLSEISTYARIDNATYRILKAHTPGPYTFLLNATAEVPKRLMHPRRKLIGIRIPDCRITLELLKALQEPLMSCSLILPQEEFPLTDPDIIAERLKSQVDLVVEGGMGGVIPTSIIDLHEDVPKVLRKGKGEVSDFE